MKQQLRKLAKRVRDKSRRTSLPVLVATIGVAAMFGFGIVLSIPVFLRSPAVTAAIAGLIGVCALLVASAAWLGIGRQLRAVRAANDRIEATQRRILAAVEQQRLEAAERENAAEPQVHSFTTAGGVL